LFLPEAWFADAYAARQTACQVPQELTFQSKPQLAAAMLQAIPREGLLPFKYVVADSLYGNRPDFLDAIDACVGVTALVAMPAETRCWSQRPQTTGQTYRYKGEVRAKRVVVAPVQAACSVGTLAASLPASSWYRRQVSEGTKGPIISEFARQRVTLCKDGLPQRTVWLVIKRTTGVEKAYDDYISNAPASTPLRIFVWLSSVRWAMEQCFEEAKTELGIGAFGDSYASRRRRRYRSNTRSRLYPTSWARRDTAPHCSLNTAAALPIHVTTDKLHMLVSLSFSGMM